MKSSASVALPIALNRILPRISVMDRYIALELVAPFLFGLGAFTSVGVAIGALFELVREVTESGLSIAIAAKIFFLQMPYFISIAIPTSLLLATLIAYSRLSSDNELIALRSCGISVYRMVLPAVILSLILTAITFTFNELVVPAARYEATITFEKALDREKPPFQESNIFYSEYGRVEREDGEKVKVLTRLFYAESFDGDRMRGLTIIDRTQPDFQQILVAETATWNPRENLWEFFDGTIYVVDRTGSYSNIVKFNKQQLQLPRAPLDLAARRRDYGEMNIAQSLNYLEIARLSGNEKRVRKLKIRIQQKVAIPFACVAFALMGAALGTRPHRTGRATGFGISVLVIFVYYLLMSIGDALGLSGIVAPWMAGWLPTLCALGAGGFLLVRAAK